MSYTLVFLAVLMGAVVWWLVKQTINLQPWSAHQLADSVRTEGVRSPLSSLPMASTKLALGVFLAVVTSLFALFISAYSIRMEYGDWRPLPEPALLWVNSGVLVLCSVFLQRAWIAARRQDRQAVKFSVVTAAALTVAFVVGQWLAWQQLMASGYAIADNPANAFFYTLTGLHALHLGGGLVALVKTIRRAWDTQASAAALSVGVELCAVYWHYLLAVWVILFSFMLTT